MNTKLWKKIGSSQEDCSPEKLSFRIDDDIKTFLDKQKLKEFTSRKPTLQIILNKLFHEEEMKTKIEH